MTDSKARLPGAPRASGASSPSTSDSSLPASGLAGIESVAADASGPRLSQSTAPAAPPVSAELRGRIQNVLAAGGFVSIDADFPDWSTVLSDNPFVVLYLDHEQADALTPELVTRHFNLLMAFWQTKLDLMSGPSHHAIVRRYGGHLLSDVLVNSYPRRLRDAYARLEAREGINAEKDRIRSERLRVGAEAIATALDVMLADGAMDPAEAKALFASGRRAELTDEEVAEILENVLKKQGFQPDAAPKGATLQAQLQSVRWSDPTRDRDSSVKPFKFEKGSAASLEQLIALCDLHVDEAEEHLFSERLSGWLSSTLGEGVLARKSSGISTSYRKQKRRGLELFVRTLCRSAGIPSEPVLEALPPKLTLGGLPTGAQLQKAVDCRVLNSRYAWGLVRLEPEIAGCSVTASFEGLRERLTIEFDLLDHAPGSYTTSIVMFPEPERTPFRIPVSFNVLPVTLAVKPASIKLGSVAYGTQVATRLEWSTTPSGGRVLGTASLVHELSGTTLSGELDGGSGEFLLAIDTHLLRAGERYEQLVRVQAGDQSLDVPVTLDIPLDRQLVMCWTYGMAILLAMVLGLVRGLLYVEPDFAGWVGDFPAVGASYVGAAVLSLALFLFWKGISHLSRRRIAVTPPSGPDAGATGP